MKKLSLLVFGLLLVGCTQPHADMNMEEHLGCQEGEVVNGECQVATDKNVDLFDRLEGVEVSETMVPYFEGTEGFLAQPTEPGTYPGVVMIHEWWGLNENIKDMARLLAAEGYVVLAVDIYEGEVATESSDAGRLASAARENLERSVANMEAAVAYLKAQPSVNAESIGSMGWCFGGQQSLNLALSTDELQATVIYYGNLVTEAEALTNIFWPVFGIFGEEDQGIPVADVNAFESTLDTLGIENEIHIYPGVGHAFANPSGTRYAPEETLDAWNKTVEFLDESLKKKTQ